jgi:uncharacterized cupredoxin-like copper-binding protein
MTGRLLVGALVAFMPFPAATAVDWSHPQVVNMVVTENIFAPGRLFFRVGVTYRLHIENQGEYLHKFPAPLFFHALEIETPAVLDGGRNEIDIPAGEQRDLLFVAMHPGSFKLRCPDYDWDGMRGDIMVAP